MPFIEQTSRRKLLLGGVALGAAAVASALGGRFLARSQAPRVILGDGVSGPLGMAWIPGGTFLMGSGHRLAQENERPAHPVRVDGFWMDTTHVTNDQFARFVRETGYVTTAERKPDWETIRVLLPPGVPRPPDEVLVPGAMVFTGTSAPVRLDDYSRWWSYVPGA
ncbi:MAG: formylglycine-generating enzyme family protein, partial [Lysobacteraceae bacterium]